MPLFTKEGEGQSLVFMLVITLVLLWFFTNGVFDTVMLAQFTIPELMPWSQTHENADKQDGTRHIVIHLNIYISLF
jgi:hypothetical protein